MAGRGLSARIRHQAEQYTQQGQQVERRGSEQVEQARQAFEGFDAADHLSPEALQALLAESDVGGREMMAQVQARAARAGIRGPLQTTFEGSVLSAVNRNKYGTAARFAGERARLMLQRAGSLADIAERTRQFGAGQRAQGLELTLGERDFEVAEEERRRARRRGLGAAIGGGLGAAGGFILGGPAGAAAGGQAGSRIGAGVGGYF